MNKIFFYKYLTASLTDKNLNTSISLEEYIDLVVENPQKSIRNVFQIFFDMIKNFVGEGYNIYPETSRNQIFTIYNFSKLLVESMDRPFFMDRILANNFIRLIEDLKLGYNQNKIYIFEGPSGSGKSIFINNLLKQFEEYCNSDEGIRYEIVWKLKPKFINKLQEDIDSFEELSHITTKEVEDINLLNSIPDDNLEVYCPNHCNPLLIIPKVHRRAFFDDLLKNLEFKWKLFTEKEYEWIFTEEVCSICFSIYQALLSKEIEPKKIFDMVYCRPFKITRRLSQGISVYNSGDKPSKESVINNPMIQAQLDRILKNSNLVNYKNSKYANTNNGIFVLMDIKSHNVNRFIELHNVISEGANRIENIEEKVNSLFWATINPEDKNCIENIPSFSDRIQYIKIPFILDYNTEIEVYKNTFGFSMINNFYPHILHSFAKIIISTRMNKNTKALLELIEDPKKYSLICDENLLLLKMEIYSGFIPSWFIEEDRKSFTTKHLQKILLEYENEGQNGISGRDSIKIFSDFYSLFSKNNSLIDMNMLTEFFVNIRKDLSQNIQSSFLDGIIRMYEYTILNEFNASSCYINQEHIKRDILNYIFSISYSPDTIEKSIFTNERISITEEYLTDMEYRLFGYEISEFERKQFRTETLKKYTSKTLTYEMNIKGLNISDTQLYNELYQRYTNNIMNDTLFYTNLYDIDFINALEAYGSNNFLKFDKSFRKQINSLINNLCSKFNYTEEGAKNISCYVLKKKLYIKYSSFNKIYYCNN